MNICETFYPKSCLEVVEVSPFFYYLIIADNYDIQRLDFRFQYNARMQKAKENNK